MSDALSLMALFGMGLIGYLCGYSNGVAYTEKTATTKAVTTLIQSHKCELLNK